MYKYIVYCSQLTAGSCCIALLKRPASIMKSNRQNRKENENQLVNNLNDNQISG